MLWKKIMKFCWIRRDAIKRKKPHPNYLREIIKALTMHLIYKLCLKYYRHVVSTFLCGPLFLTLYFWRSKNKNINFVRCTTKKSCSSSARWNTKQSRNRKGSQTVTSELQLRNSQNDMENSKHWSKTKWALTRRCVRHWLHTKYIVNFHFCENVTIEYVQFLTS